MPRKDHSSIIVILDRSGSMSIIKSETENGFNKFISEQRKVPGTCDVTLVQFDSQSIDTVYEGWALDAVPRLVLDPRGSTPLLDAVGETITATGTRLAAMPEEQRPENVICIIITDGQENASHTYTRARIKEMIEHQTTVYKWDFIYMGANVDAFHEASAMGVAYVGTMNYDPTATSVQSAYSIASDNVARYRGGNKGGFTTTEIESVSDKNKKAKS